MHKTIKILICLFIISFCSVFFQNSFAKYIIESSNVIAKLNIDRCKPNIELLDINTSNTDYPYYANKLHLITGHIKIIEKNIVKNNLSSDTIKILVNNIIVKPTFLEYKLVSENANEKIYKFTFTNTLGNGALNIEIPNNVVEDKSGLTNDQKKFSTNIIIDNIAPSTTLQEIVNSDGISSASLTCNEQIRPILGWQMNNNTLSKNFPNNITYELPIIDFANNISKALIDIKNATSIILEYGTHDAYSAQTLVTGGQISSPRTISSNSICKTEAIFMKLSGNIDSSSLQARCYINTHWGEGAYNICIYSELPYYNGYNPPSSNEWIDSTTRNYVTYYKRTFTQLGGLGLNRENAMAANVKIPIPSNIAKQYLYGISGIQFRLKDCPDYSIVYQAYVRDFGWLAPSSNGEENLYDHSKPMSAFRMNIVPKSEEKYLIDYWAKDVKTSNIN